MPLDYTEDDLISLTEIERVAHRLRDGDLAFGRDPSGDVHFFSLLSD
jgi:hypothetical protein